MLTGSGSCGTEHANHDVRLHSMMANPSALRQGTAPLPLAADMRLR